MFEDLEKIVCVTSRKLCEKPLEKRLGELAKLGLRNVILREKDLSEEEYIALAKKIMPIPDIELTLHNFPNAARRLSINRIHLPLSMLTVELCEEFETVGASVHSVEEAHRAEQLGASYIIAGHIFATDCKRDLPPRGLEFLDSVCRAVKIPVYAIGGITPENLQAVLSTGAKGA